MECRRLNYHVHRFSSFEPGYEPQNVLVDKPFDQSSRWCTADVAPPQFLILKLNKPAIVKSITFGKYHKIHVCNIRKFSISGGMHDDNFIELLTGDLENNNAKETFSLEHKTKDGQLFPIQYIRIVPHLSWSPPFNFSIWYVELYGIDDPEIIKNVLFRYNLFAEKETIRICLKHFRQQKYSTAFNELQKQTGVVLEAPQLSLLYSLLVEKGDFEGAEKLLLKADREGLFDWYASKQPYVASWNNVSPCSPELAARLTDSMDISLSPPSPPPITSMSPIQEGDTCLTQTHEFKDMIDNDIRLRPGQRGGHQMCIDPVTNTIFLFGGWDGENDLNDMWSYNISEDKWSLISKSNEDLSPSPRSCHKMVLDPIKRQIYLLGRYLDAKNRTPENTKSDLYVFDLNEWRWWKLCEDTAAEGGPLLIFDHQMCIDVEKHIIYVFGGRILLPTNEGEDLPPQYSGFYAYYINDHKWRLLLSDSVNSLKPNILSRVGHSMLFHPITRTLYIFGGQRDKEHQADLLAVNVEGIENDGSEVYPIVQAVCTAAPTRHAPPTGFTQRATIDPELNEIYVLSGLSKEKDKRVSNSLWVFSITQSQWSCIYKNDNQGVEYWSKMQMTEPCPRFAHQLVYDPVGKIHYLFGGNPGRATQPRLRLDDFWILKLSRTNSTSALWQARLQLRCLRYRELAEAGKAHEALNYLQTHLYQATDHSDPEQTLQFQKLATMLFSEKDQDISFNPPLECSDFMTGYEDFIQGSSNIDQLDFSRKSQSSAAEQQAMFAAVLGMETSSNNSPNKLADSQCSGNSSSLGSEEIQRELTEFRVEESKWNDWEVHYRRCQLFQQLSEFFPQHMVQPKKNLTDYIVFCK